MRCLLILVTVMNNKKIWLALCLVLVGAGGWLLQSQQSVLSAQWHFSQGAFEVMAVEHNAGHTLIKLQLLIEQAQLNVMAYRPCPYEEDAIWAFQPQGKLELAFYVDEKEVARTICDSAWSVSREVNMLLALPTE